MSDWLADAQTLGTCASVGLPESGEPLIHTVPGSLVAR
jgi:hypothetical protein